MAQIVQLGPRPAREVGRRSHALQLNSEVRLARKRSLITGGLVVLILLSGTLSVGYAVSERPSEAPAYSASQSHDPEVRDDGPARTAATAIPTDVRDEGVAHPSQ